MRVGRKLAGLLAVLAFGTFGANAAGSGGSAGEAFEKMKALVGDWETQTSNMQQKGTLHMELTAGGTALLEKFRMEDNGKPVEMITLYYVDGDKLKLTHYCMAGNQPTMAGAYDPEKKTIKFDFAGISNLKSPDSGHMHHALYTFLDNDHFKTNWTFRRDQKDSFTEDVTYVRVK